MQAQTPTSGEANTITTRPVTVSMLLQRLHSVFNEREDAGLPINTALYASFNGVRRPLTVDNFKVDMSGDMEFEGTPQAWPLHSDWSATVAQAKSAARTVFAPLADEVADAIEYMAAMMLTTTPSPSAPAAGDTPTVPRELLERLAERAAVFDDGDDGADSESARSVAAELRALLDRQPVPAMTAAAHDVLAERQRQVSAKGWTPAHDDGHACGEIAAFAAVYAMPEGARDWDASSTGYGATLAEALAPDGWAPKFGNRRRELVKAGALILAEIERIDRQSVEGAAQ